MALDCLRMAFGLTIEAAPETIQNIAKNNKNSFIHISSLLEPHSDSVAQFPHARKMVVLL